jgi:hypothetical protein
VTLAAPALFMIDAPAQHGVKARGDFVPDIACRAAFRLDPALGAGALE